MMSRKNLGIMFLVGFVLLAFVMIMTPNVGNIFATGWFFILVPIGVIGGLLMMLSGSSLLKRLNRHMDG